MKSLKRFLTVIVLMAVVFTFMPVIEGQVYAASKKKPEAPKNLSANASPFWPTLPRAN